MTDNKLIILVLKIFRLIYFLRNKAVLSQTVKRNIFCSNLQELYFDCRYRKEIFLFFKTNGPTLEPTRLLTWHVLGAHYSLLKRPDREAEQTHPSGVQIKKDLLYHQPSEAPSRHVFEVNTRTILPLPSILSSSDICLLY